MRFFTSFYVIVTAKLVFSSQCNGGYFSEENKACIDCPEHCLICKSSEICLSCEDGYWGNICELPCSRCQPKTSCEKTNGFCLENCKDGYTGILCDAFCNDKCFNCDRMNAGLCDLCALGHYGKSCDNRCPEFCNNNTCNNSGYCNDGCDSGYWGPKCGNNCSSNCKHSSCDPRTGECTSGCKSNFVGSRCDSVKNDINVDVSRNKGEENEKKAANVEEKVQPANDDKENEASHQGGEIWPVILTVVAVLIVIVSVVVCVVYRKKLINLRRRGLLRQGKPDISAERPFLETTETKTSKDSGICSQESPHTSVTQDTVPMLQDVITQYPNNEPRKETVEQIFGIPIIPEFPAEKIAVDLNLTQCLLQQDKNLTMEAPSISFEKVPRVSGENNAEVDLSLTPGLPEQDKTATIEAPSIPGEKVTSLSRENNTVKRLRPGTALYTNNDPRNDQSVEIIIIPEYPADKIAADLCLTQGLLQQDKTTTTEAPSIDVEKAPSPSMKHRIESAKSSDRGNTTGLDNDSRAEARVSLESLRVRHISDFSGTKAYIICKDPTKKAMTDSVFWKLVWQEGCSVIVMLCGAAEETPERRYWPEREKNCIYGDFIVTNEGVVFFDDYIRRTFTIKKDQKTEPRKVEQIQFIKWPIFKLPDDKSLINFCHEVNEDRKTCHGPLLVHCRDGFSRSCVFVAVDILLGVLEKKDCGEIGNILIKLEEKGLITTTEHRTFLRKSWEVFSTQMNTKEGLSELPNKASPSVLNTTVV